MLSQFGLGEGTVSQRCCLSLGPLPREFSALISSLGVPVWSRKAGKAPYPVSLLVPPWQFLLWEICGNRRLFSSHNETITVVPDTSVEYIVGTSLYAPFFFFPSLCLTVDFVEPRGTREMKAVCLYAWQKSHSSFPSSF